MNHETPSDVFASFEIAMAQDEDGDPTDEEEKRSTALARVQSELDIKLQENDETAAATRLTDAASVVRWWQTRVRVARTRARLLAKTDEREGFTRHKRHTREQLILGSRCTSARSTA